MKTDFKYTIQEHIGTVSTSEDGRFAIEVNLISYNDAPAKVDVRKWNRETGRMQKGITLTKEEAETLGQILLGWDGTKGEEMEQAGGADHDRETDTKTDQVPD